MHTQDRKIVVLATDARINERLIARGMDPMRGPCLADVLHEAIGERLTSKDALRLWDPDRLAGDPRVRAVLSRYVEQQAS
ncbi:hypothetical protein HNP73_000852 [Amaricoccus macauensis]|jgi:hypothetical protein|uniref:Uncharacterized protein n=1 Tax=Amaricoccus macauensis TaxID=57001 RepID=A0A840SNQ4_9RHOB|nr:hypothetical protein [Amaricoccus macauensis]MBB5220931.1 hypothetical protein [Amaricoccus macauensis]